MTMIPKIIHYCWFGGSPKNEKIRFCMESWKKVLPDYEIREWSEKDLFRFSDNRYVRQAYEAKKWAFVSDVFRLFALYKEGGIYLDTDVEVRKTFSPLLEGDFFIGSEKHGRFESIGTAVIGAAAGNGIIKDMLSVYENLDFIPKNRIPDLTPNTVRLVPVFQKYGIVNVYSNVHIPLGRGKWLGLYRYKRIKPEAKLAYPETMKKKIWEWDYAKRKKILLTYEEKGKGE